MSAVDWIGWAVATAICLLLGWWLHTVNRKPEDERIESLAIGFGWAGLAFVLLARAGGAA